MLKNKKIFLFLLIFFLFSIIFIWILTSIFFKWIDRNTYLELISGEWYLNEKALSIWNKEKLSENDIIETKTPDSLAIIEWWDWSITRLWWNSKMQIREQFISKNKDDIKIAFNLFSWKSWSNVISYLWEDSYFKQSFSDTEAAVRWTIFTVDLENDYVQVEKHKVDLVSESKWETEILENKQLQISNFKFISFEDFIKYFKDKNFFNLNLELDKEFFIKKSLELQNSVKDILNYTSMKIDDLTKEQREKLYTKILSKYQDINFVSLVDSEKLFGLKIALKEKLIELAPENSKWWILNTLSYDLQDIFKKQDFTNFEQITNILIKNEKYIDVNKFFNNINLNFNIKEVLNKWIDIFEEFKETVFKSQNFKEWLDVWKNIADWIWRETQKAIENQKWVFLEIWDFIKNIFN